MGSASWAVPVGVLLAIVAASLAFIWWWFPNAWNKGVSSERAQVDQVTGEEREAQRQANRAIIERFARARAMERGEIPPDALSMPAPAVKGSTRAEVYDLGPRQGW